MESKRGITTGAFVGSVATILIAFIGSWVQINSRISAMEIQINYLERGMDKVQDLDAKIDVVIEQNKWIKERLERLEEKN